MRAADTHRIGPAFAAIGLLALACVDALAAAPLPADPTRPPGGAGLGIGTGDSPRAARPATTAAAIALRAPTPNPAPLPALQALIQPQHGPASALLDGRWLRAGEALRAWHVEAIRADGLLLRPLPEAHRPNREPVWLPLVAPLDRRDPPPAPPGPDTARTARSDARKEP